MKLSIIIPIHNEEDILEKNISQFIQYFNKQPNIDKFQIIIIENGSTDNTLSIAKKLTQKHKIIKLIIISQRSLGLALLAGIKKSSYPYIYFNAIDNPFNFTDFDQFIKKIPSFNLIFASKNHSKSKYEKRFLRKIASSIYSLLIRLFFNLPLTDTQGTFLAKRNKLLSLLPFCTSKTAFFQTQIAIYAKIKGLKIKEIPVSYIPKHKKSHFSILKDGSKMLFELLAEKLKLCTLPVCTR